MHPLLLKDGYKVDHRSQYPAGTTRVYSNLTPRSGRIDGCPGIIFFGLQYFCQEFLDKKFQRFFSESPAKAAADYKRVIDAYLGPDVISVDHVAALNKLGYLPLLIKAVPEGTLVPYGVPALTIVNTHDDFFWLTNMLETLMSSVLWKMSTSATMAWLFRRKFQSYAQETSDSTFLVPWQGHDFSFRGMSGPEDAARSGAGHLLSFTGTDTIPALVFLEEYYGALLGEELVGGSVPATEHSVMCMGTALEGELETYRRLVTETYPSGIVSIVSDTYDYWHVICDILPALKPEIMARHGGPTGDKVVVRPDSGNPVHIVVGDPDAAIDTPEFKGTIQCLWEEFGGVVNSKGYKELDPHIGVIYGDSINLDKQERILAGLKAKGFASTNIVMGIGSYTYQYTTRDVHGFAVKATAGATKADGWVPIFKDPKTDSKVGGSKKSHKGLLQVLSGPDGLFVRQDVTPEEETEGLLFDVYRDGQLVRIQCLSDIRATVEAQL